MIFEERSELGKLKKVLSGATSIEAKWTADEQASRQVSQLPLDGVGSMIMDAALAEKTSAQMLPISRSKVGAQAGRLQS